MPGVRGNNVFHGAFDFFEWSAKYYTTPLKVTKALERCHFKGKTIHRINAVGQARYFPGSTLLYDQITNAGIELGDDWWMEGASGCYPHLKKVKVPWEVELCEPVQFVFEDGTTFEILPVGNGGARIAENSIPKGLVDGLNHSNFDPNTFFREAVGRRIKDIGIYVEKTFKDHYASGRKDSVQFREERTLYRFVIGLDDDPYRLELQQGWGSWYQMKAGSPYRLFAIGAIPYSRVEEALKETDQICIVNGREGDGTFQIVPVCLNKEKEKKRFSVSNYGISVDNIDLFHYIGDLLTRFFDPSIQDKTQNDYEGRRFDDFGVNYYSFCAMKKILGEIARRITLLENGAEDPAVRLITDHISWYDYTDKRPEELKENEMETIERKSLEKAIDFYRRFHKRILDTNEVGFIVWFDEEDPDKDDRIKRCGVTREKADHIYKLVWQVADLVCPMMACVVEQASISEYAYAIE